MQELLIKNKVDKELPERQAERALQDATARRAEDARDIKVIEKWHISTIQPRIVEWQNRAFQDHQACPFGGEVLFCDMKVNEERDVWNIVDTKEALVKAWYEDKHGLKNMLFRSNTKGTLRYFRFDFHSADIEDKVRSQCLKGRNNFDANVRAALFYLRSKGELPVHVLKVIKQFIPDYLEHLKQEKDSVEKAPRW
jgi:hypothetical protein